MFIVAREYRSMSIFTEGNLCDLCGMQVNGDASDMKRHHFLYHRETGLAPTLPCPHCGKSSLSSSSSISSSSSPLSPPLPHEETLLPVPQRYKFLKKFFKIWTNLVFTFGELICCLDMVENWSHQKTLTVLTVLFCDIKMNKMHCKMLRPPAPPFSAILSYIWNW